VFLKWFGNHEATGYTSLSEHWHFLKSAHTPPQTHGILARLCDMRIPLSLAVADCETIAAIIAEELAAVTAGEQRGEDNRLNAVL
jgi:hypothetical protein